MIINLLTEILFLNIGLDPWTKGVEFLHYSEEVLLFQMKITIRFYRQNNQSYSYEVEISVLKYSHIVKVYISLNV